MRWLLFSMLLAAALWGCDASDEIPDTNDDSSEPGDGSEPNGDSGDDPGDDPGEPPLAFVSCTDGAEPDDLETVDWTNISSAVITLGSPWHSSQDVVAVGDGTTPVAGAIAGKFSYGALSKDLEGERIEVWIDDCAGGYRRLGERVTDSDGRIALPLVDGDVPGPGEYALYLRVMGDNSTARSTLRVYPPETSFIVFDIDATLTTSDSELVGQVIWEILASEDTPEARVDALAATELRHYQHGYELVYLTGRPYLLDGITRDWLSDLGFPSGTVRLTDEVASSWPSDSQVGEYKRAFLQSLVDAGFRFDAAYGNATTDIYAYQQIGVPDERIFVLGEHGGENGTVALGEGYTEHLDAVDDEPAADQPFQR